MNSSLDVDYDLDGNRAIFHCNLANIAKSFVSDPDGTIKVTAYTDSFDITKTNWDNFQNNKPKFSQGKNKKWSDEKIEAETLYSQECSSGSDKQNKDCKDWILAERRAKFVAEDLLQNYLGLKNEPTKSGTQTVSHNEPLIDIIWFKNEHTKGSTVFTSNASGILKIELRTKTSSCPIEKNFSKIYPTPTNYAKGCKLVTVSFTEKLSYFDALYFAAYTMTTTGYGDYQPATDFAKMLTVWMNLLEFIFIALVLTIYTTRTEEVTNKQKGEQEKQQEGKPEEKQKNDTGAGAAPSTVDDNASSKYYDLKRNTKTKNQ